MRVIVSHSRAAVRFRRDPDQRLIATASSAARAIQRPHPLGALALGQVSFHRNEVGDLPAAVLDREATMCSQYSSPFFCG